jgi:energy-coupling factor transport system ATP-binding protein
MTIDLRDITFSYRTQAKSSSAVVDGLSLSIQQGECVGIIGQEGAGKTTLLQLMAGLLKPDIGTIILDGTDIWGRHASSYDLRKRIGFAFQFPEQQFFCETVGDELMYAMKTFGYSEGFMAPEQALTMLGLQASLFMDRSPFSLSMGEARRVALATLLMTKPSAFLLDEPTVGLDGAGVDVVLDLLGRMKADQKTIAVVSHDVDVLAEVASRIIIMEEGKIRRDGSVQEIFTNTDLLLSHGYQVPGVVSFMREEGHIAEDRFYTFHEAKRLLEQRKRC